MSNGKASQGSGVCERLDRIAEMLEKIVASLATPAPPPALDPSKIDWEGQGTDAARKARWEDEGHD